MKPFLQTPFVTLHHGDVREVLAEMEPGSVHCVVSSPPYWGLRDYKLEPSVWETPNGMALDETEHEWEKVTGTERRRPRSDDVEIPGSSDNGVRRGPRSATPTSASCWKCGAWRGNLGLEPTPALYIQHMVEVFRAIRCVLRDDGTVWLNLGDSYASAPGERGTRGTRNEDPKYGRGERQTNGPNRAKVDGLKPLDLIGMPWRVALALQADGWYLRSDIIWAKPNPMPESVNGVRWERCRVKVEVRTERTFADGRRVPFQSHSGETMKAGTEWADCPGCPKCDHNEGLVLRRGSWRPTSSYEHIFMLTKTADYYGDGDGVREAQVSSHPSGNGFKRDARLSYRDKDGPRGADEQWQPSGGGRNLRDVWTITPQPTKLKHYATYPEALVEKCILASTSDKGVCAECGDPWARVIKLAETDRTQKMADGWDTGSGAHGTVHRNGREAGESGKPVMVKQTIGWRPTCGHETDPVPATILDPFVGSGTSCLMASKLGRRSIGIDLSEEYLEMAKTRLDGVQPRMMVS